MSRKRDVLAVEADELLAAVDRFDLPVQDRRGKAALVEALAGSRKMGIEANTVTVSTMECTSCQSPTKKFSRDRKENQRYRCLNCRKTCSER
jgi:hypothetical protein